MYYHIFIFNALLFFILVPNILVSFSSNTSKYIVAFVHALIFGVLFTTAFKYYKEIFLQEGKSKRKKREKREKEIQKAKEAQKAKAERKRKSACGRKCFKECEQPTPAATPAVEQDSPE